MYPVDAKQIAFHRKMKDLLAAVLIDQDSFQETGMNQVQRIESLSYGMDALPALELHILEQQFFIAAQMGRRHMQQIAYLFQG